MTLQKDPELLDTTTGEIPVVDAPTTPTLDADVEERPLNVFLTCVAVFLSATAAGWMCAGIFSGGFAKVVALIGPLVGAGMVAISYRTQRPSVVQYLALPAAILVGALLVIPDATGGTANLPGLVREAISSGGVAQPPIPFDPGWKFILVVLTAVLAAAGASLAIGTGRPKLGAFLPAPLVFGAALVQPKEGTLFTTGVALVLLIGALGVAYGVELQREGATSGQFELRRLARGAGIVLLLLTVLWGLSQAGFLFPEADRDQVIPPKRPDPQPPQRDRVLFKVNADRPGPWRLGVLDVYQDHAWMLPSFDTARFQDIDRNGTIPAAKRGEGVPVGPQRRATKAEGRFVATFTVNDIEGHVIPSIAGAASVTREDGFKLSVDPRTGMLRLPDARARHGMRYVVTAPLPPTAKQMAAAPAPPARFASFFTHAPPPPAAVATLLAQAPRDNAFARLQYVRNAFYQKVVAAGSGQPVDVSPSRVVDMLDGDEATPYEITAAEALLARWAGIPARIGYGHYAGDKQRIRDQTYEVHPKHGSTWLEAYFQGYGWVPIIGTPPKAKSSLSEKDKKDEPNVRPTKDLALIVYVPVRLQSIRLLFVVVRYWTLLTLPFLLGCFLLWGFFPGMVKMARRFRRRRWAASGDLVDRIMVAYAEFRDAANDLNVGDANATALEFCEAIEPDGEHVEFAWLVSRVVWGDLTRDLRAEDVEAAEDMSSSLVRRLRRGAPAITRVLGFGSRASLRDPYTDEIPNLWPSWARRGVVRDAIRRFLSAIRRAVTSRKVWRLLPFTGLLIVIASLTMSCTGASANAPAADLTKAVLPSPVVPATVRGVTFKREKDAEEAYKRAGAEGLVAEGRVYTLRNGNDVKGALEVGAFKPGMRATEREIREGVISSIGTGNFELTRIGLDRIFVQRLPEQRIFLWFPPRMQYFELMIARQGFDDAEQLFTSVLAFQRGEEFDIAHEISEVPDPRRGAPT